MLEKYKNALFKLFFSFLMHALNNEDKKYLVQEMF